MDEQQAWPQGVFPARLIEMLAQTGAIKTTRAFDTDQVQPASRDLRQGVVLARGGLYLVPLQDSLAVRPVAGASAHAQRSAGSLDVGTRVIGDRARGFDQMPAAYQGPVYDEVSPRTFPILARTG